MSKNGGKIMFAGLLGALAGAVGGLLFAPKSGKKTREDILNMANRIAREMKTGAKETESRVKDVFGKVSQEATGKYEEVSGAVADRIAAVKSAGENIDKEKYGQIVDEVVSNFKGEWKETKGNYAKLVTYLKADWEKVKSAVVEEPKTAEKPMKNKRRVIKKKSV